MLDRWISTSQKAPSEVRRVYGTRSRYGQWCGRAYVRLLHVAGAELLWVHNLKGKRYALAHFMRQPMRPDTLHAAT